MDLQGRIIAALPAREGESARGPWKAQDFVLETHDAYPKKMVFSVWGEDRLQRFNVQEGQEVMVSFDIDAHEYQGRWYNSIRAYDVRLVDPSTIQPVQPVASAAALATAPAASAEAPAAAPAQDAVPFPETAEGESADDLPF